MRALTRASVAIACLFVGSAIFAKPLNIFDVANRIADANRIEGDADRDDGRKPAQVMSFLGVDSTMTGLDVMASGGWYTDVLASLLTDGKVYAQNPPAFLAYRDGYYDKALSSRLASGRLPNVVRLDKDFADLGLHNEVDVAVSALNLHDLYNRDPAAAAGMMKAVYEALKPGGVFGVIDHDGNADGDNAKLHRMTMKQAIDVAKAAGFNVETSDILRNPDDDHTLPVFNPEVRGKTDRFLLKLTKPK